VRPGSLTPALASALVAGGPQATAFPATLLDLAGRGALAIEPESAGGVFSKPKVQVRLRNDEAVTDEVEVAVWRQLEKRAHIGIVSSKDLSRIAADQKEIRKALERQISAAGWKDPHASGDKGWLGLIFVVALLLAIFTVVVAAAGDTWLPVIATVALAIVAIAALVMLGSYSNLSLAGQEAALPWTAYREGLERAAKDPSMFLDLDAVLPDVVAMVLGSAMDDRLKEAAEAGAGLRIFQNTVGGTSDAAAMSGYFPFWVAFTASTAPPSSSGSGTVSGGGAGGGGGAAGST
jgi:hypothetical protein